jgi:hypothetical protein
MLWLKTAAVISKPDIIPRLAEKESEAVVVIRAIST